MENIFCPHWIKWDKTRSRINALGDQACLRRIKIGCVNRTLWICPDKSYANGLRGKCSLHIEITYFLNFWRLVFSISFINLFDVNGCFVCSLCTQIDSLVTFLSVPRSSRCSLFYVLFNGSQTENSLYFLHFKFLLCFFFIISLFYRFHSVLL